MITHRSVRTARSRRHRPARTVVRAAAVALVLGMSMFAVPAFADEPVAWKPEPHVSGFDFLLVLLLIPLGIALVISLLVVLPSLLQGSSYDPTKAWAGTREWFGGPRKEVEELDEDRAGDTGGAGAEW